MKTFSDFFVSKIDDFKIDPDTIKVINEIISEYFPQSDNDVQKLMSVSANKNTVMKHVILSANCTIDIKTAEAALIDVDSFGRANILHNISRIVSKDDWLALFKSNWHMSDSCSLFHEEFREILSTYDMSYIRETIHDELDREFYDQLPETFTVYRGTFIDEDFAQGISWTTDKEVASRFMLGYQSFADKGGMYYRYASNIDHGLLEKMNEIAESGVTVLERTVNKADVFVTTSRGESEVILL